MRDMRKLTELLENSVNKAKFSVWGLGSVTQNKLKILSKDRRKNGRIGPFSKEFNQMSKIEINDGHISDLVVELNSVLNVYLNPKTGCIGNGLVYVIGGSIKEYTLAEYAKILIKGAAALGSERMVELLDGWINGEPLRYRENIVLEGIVIDGDSKLEEGMHLMELPDLNKNLRPSPNILIDMYTMDYPKGVVLSVEFEQSPALYKPEGMTPWEPLERSFELVCKIPGTSINSICKSISLACNHYVRRSVSWLDFGELSELSESSAGIARSGMSTTTKAIPFSHDHLTEARKIFSLYHANKKKKTSLDVAIDWWMRSKLENQPHQSSDYKLIELRIALEALYLRERSSEISFRLPIHAAWHLGTDYSQREYYYETLRKVYKDASCVIHAKELSYKEKDWERFSVAQDICREGILKRLEESEEPKWEKLILNP